MSRINIFAPVAYGQGVVRRAAMLLVMMLTATTAWADDSGNCGTNVTYSYVESTHTLTISGSGAMEDYEYSYDRPWYNYVYKIETIVIEDGVTSIGMRAFYATGLTSIEIPASVTSIGEYAFNGCSGLETISVAAGNAVYDSRNDCNAIIEKATSTLIQGCKTTIIPDGVTSIGDYAFENTDPTTVTIPASVTSIGKNAFGGCCDLSMVTFAPGSQLTTIGEGAFNYTGLTTITIPASVTSIGKEVFTLCGGLETISVAAGNTVYDSRNDCNAIIEKATSTLIQGCKNTVIPDGVTSIGDNAFDGHGPATITIPASVTTIGEAAFEASGLTTVTFATDSKLTTICNCAFHDNPLGSITIPASVTSIGSMAFYDCPWLATVTFDGTPTLTSIGDNAFDGRGLTTITIPASVTSIGDVAFHECTGLKNVMLNGEATIGWDAFPNGATVIIAEGMLLHNGTEPLSGNVSDISKLNGKTLKTAYSVTFDIADDDNDPEAQIVVRGNKVAVPTVARTGYTLKWKLGEEDYDFDTPVNSNIALTAVWTANNYTVQFSANGGSGDAMAPMQLTYDGDWAMLPACTYTAPEGKAFKNWNTAANGSGDSYDVGEWVRNLTGEPNGTVTLYAQWGKDIANCTATVPGQTLDGYSYIFYKFESANNGNVETGATVYDGETLLTVGTDYVFDQVYFYGTENSSTYENNKVGDHFTVVIKGIGNYAGTTTADFYLVSPEVNGTWGDLTWTIDADGDFTITGSGAMNETTKGNYPWYDKAGYIKTITIGEGITSVAANAFCREVEMNVYGNVHSLTLPESLTSIGEFAFAYCTGLTNVTIYAPSLDNYGYYAFNYNASGRKIYVFSEYLNDYKTGWSDYADDILPIEGIALVDNANNNGRIAAAEGLTIDVTLQGRTLYKDGDWNTLTLPFALVSLTGTPLEGATVMELDDAEGKSGFNAETGSLSLYFKEATSIVAGKPYLVKWETTGDDIVNPVFTGVTINKDVPDVTSDDGNVTFIGNYDPVVLPVGDASNLYLGAGNKLYWPSKARTINACRGYFHVNLDGVGHVREFNLNFDGGETVTGVESVQGSRFKVQDTDDDAWYTLDGVRLSEKPRKKGIYIHGGKKVVVK